MQDRAEQALHLLALAPIAETTGDSHSYGFRTLRATHDAIAQCFNILSRRASPQWILEADIAGCFDNIDHQWLMTHIPIDFHIHNALWRWTKRRHRNKSHSWIRQRYFQPQAGSRSQFQEPFPTIDSSTSRKLFLATSLPIRRHVKVRQHVNPYDPLWEVYCEQRLFNICQEYLKITLNSYENSNCLDL